MIIVNQNSNVGNSIDNGIHKVGIRMTIIRTIMIVIALKTIEKWE